MGGRSHPQRVPDGRSCPVARPPAPSRWLHGFLGDPSWLASQLHGDFRDQVLRINTESGSADKPCRVSPLKSPGNIHTDGVKELESTGSGHHTRPAQCSLGKHPGHFSVPSTVPCLSFCYQGVTLENALSINTSKPTLGRAHRRPLRQHWEGSVRTSSF